MTGKKNILFISYDGMTDPLGQSQVIPYLAGLTKYGYNFTILSCEKPEKFASHRNYVEGLLRQSNIKWAYIPYHKKPPVHSSRYYVMIKKKKVKELQSKQKKRKYQQHRKNNIDLVEHLKNDTSRFGHRQNRFSDAQQDRNCFCDFVGNFVFFETPENEISVLCVRRYFRFAAARNLLAASGFGCAGDRSYQRNCRADVQFALYLYCL